MDPRILARFILDENENPFFKQGKKYKHYKVTIYIQSPPSETFAVTYELHESYSNPAREVFDKKTNFELTLTSYGDYSINAKLREKSYNRFITRGLFEALNDNYKQTNNRHIMQGLMDIKNH